MQRAFVADAAHELRSPLTALQLQLQLIERAESTDARVEAIAELKAGLNATHTVHQMLTARLEPGASEDAHVPVSLADLARGVVLEQAPLAEARGIDLGLAAADAGAVVMGDADALRILLANLVGNALRYTPSGGQVDVACGLADGQAYLEVADSGPGILPAERERCLDRFYRGPVVGEDGAYGGSGLGCPSCAPSPNGTARASSLDEAAFNGSGGLGGLRARVIFAWRRKPGLGRV